MTIQLNSMKLIYSRPNIYRFHQVHQYLQLDMWVSLPPI